MTQVSISSDQGRLGLTTLLRWAVILSILLLASLFGIYGGNQSVGIPTAVVAIGFMLVLWAMLYFGSQRILGLTAIFSFLFLSSALPAIVILVAFPALAIYPLPLGEPSDALSIVFLGLVAFVFGALVQDNLLFHRRGPQGSLPRVAAPATASLPHMRLVFLTLGTVYLASQLPYALGISQYLIQVPSSFFWNTIQQLVILLFDPDSITLLALIVASRQGSDRKRKLLFASIIAAAYVLLTLAGGSRSGILRVAFFAVVIFVVVDIAESPDLKKLLLVLAGSVVISILFFSVGTSVRILHSAKNNDQISYVSVSAALRDAFPDGVVMGAANRLAAPFFYAMGTTVTPANEGAKDRYFSWEYTIKNVLNNVPGTPFPEAELNTSRVFGVVYRGIGEYEVRQQKGYFSELYTAWGIAALVCGFPGAFGCLALLGFCLGIVVSLAWVYRGRFPLTYLWVIWALPGAILWSAGIDHSVWLLMVSAVRLWFSALLLDTVSRLAGKVTINWKNLFFPEVPVAK